MPIRAICPACQRGHTAPDHLAGKTLSCRACGQPLLVPPLELDAAAILLAGDAEPLALQAVPEPVAEPPRQRIPKKTKPVVLPPLTTAKRPVWHRYLHWALVFALIPLAFSLLRTGEPRNLIERVEETLAEAKIDEDEWFDRNIHKGTTADSMIQALPGHKLKGAWFERSSLAHWLLALAAAGLYMAFLVFLASDGSARGTQILLVGIITATVGIGLLLLVQTLASLTDGRLVVGRGIMTILFSILKFNSFSYRAADDEDNNFFLSFIGFTLGVGLCEELVKTLPLYFHQDPEGGKVWRGLFLWGLASGAGFGIAEGIIYSARYYNGVYGPQIYLVRFVSCVALHAIWSGSVAVTLYLLRGRFENLSAWYDWIGPTVTIVAVPAILHGLYDTCLKKDLPAMAMLVAVASFGFLAFLTSRLQASDDVAATDAMLREYKRRKKAMG